MDERSGSYSICGVCGWEDDNVQLRFPRMRGGANRDSLFEYQSQVLRDVPLAVTSVNGYTRDPGWRPLRDDDAPLGGDAAASSSDDYYWKK